MFHFGILSKSWRESIIFYIFAFRRGFKEFSAPRFPSDSTTILDFLANPSVRSSGDIFLDFPSLRYAALSVQRRLSSDAGCNEAAYLKLFPADKIRFW